MELYQYKKTPFAAHLAELRDDVLQHVVGSQSKGLAEKLCARFEGAVWTKEGEGPRRLTPAGYGLLRWVARYLGDEDTLDHVKNRDFDRLTAELPTSDKVITDAGELLAKAKTKKKVIGAFEKGGTRQEVYARVRECFFRPGILSTGGSPTHVITHSLDSAIAWMISRDMGEEAPNENEGDALVGFLDEELNRRHAALHAINLLLPVRCEKLWAQDRKRKARVSEKPCGYLISQLLGLVFIRFTPSFGGMYYHYVSSDIIPACVKAHFRENVEIPFHTGTVGHLPNTDVRSDWDDPKPLALQRCFSDLRGIMSYDDSMLGHRSWIGCPVYGHKTKEVAYPFLGIAIVNFPIDCLFIGRDTKPSDEDPITGEVCRCFKDAIKNKRDGLDQASKDEVTNAADELKDVVRAAAEHVGSLSDSNGWKRLIRLIMPSGGHGERQNAYFGFSMATAWKKELSIVNGQERTNHVLQAASLLDTALTRNFEPLTSRRAAVLPAWRSTGEERMNEYCKVLFEPRCGRGHKAVWDHPETNGGGTLKETVSDVWKRVRKDVKRGNCGGHTLAEEAHATLHGWRDGVRHQVCDLMVPLFCPKMGDKKKCGRCPRYGGQKGADRRLAAILRINCYELDGVAASESPGMAEIREAVADSYKALAKVTKPVCLYRQIEENNGPLQRILGDDFEDAWYSMVCKFLLSVDAIDETFVADSVAGAFDTCLSFSNERGDNTKVDWAASDNGRKAAWDALSALKPLRATLREHIDRRKKTSVLGMSVWNRKRRFRLIKEPYILGPNGEKEPIKAMEPDAYQKPEEAILDPIENRIIAKALALLSRRDRGGTTCVRIDRLGMLFADADANLVHMNTLLAKMAERSEKGFHFMHVGKIHSARRKWRTIFCDKKLDHEKAMSKDCADLGIKSKALVAEWREDLVFENADWVCAHSDLGEVLFSKAIGHEELDDETFENTVSSRLYRKTRKSSEYWKTASGEGESSPTERELINGRLVHASHLLRVRIPGQIGKGKDEDVGELRFFSLFEDPRYDKGSHNQGLWGVYKRHKTWETIRKFGDATYQLAKVLEPEEKVVKGFAAGLRDSYRGEEHEEVVRRLARAALAGAFVEGHGEEAEILAKVHNLCQKVLKHNKENQSLQIRILLIDEMDNARKHLGPVLAGLADLNLSLTTNDFDPLEQEQEAVAFWNRVQSVQGHEPILVIASDGSVGDIWLPKASPEPVAVKDVRQLAFATESSLSKDSRGIVFSLPGDGTVRVFAEGLQIVEFTRGAWQCRDVRDLIQRAFHNEGVRERLENKEGQQIGIDNRDFAAVLSAALLSADLRHGCCFVFEKMKKLDVSEGEQDGFGPKNFGLQVPAMARDIPPRTLAGLAWTDGATLIARGAIKQVAAFLRPATADFEISGKHRYAWGMRHKSVAHFVKEKDALAVIASTTGRITVLSKGDIVVESPSL